MGGAWDRVRQDIAGQVALACRVKQAVAEHPTAAPADRAPSGGIGTRSQINPIRDSLTRVNPMETLLSVVDHLVYATPDVEATSGSIEALFGVRPVAGGQHPAWGTRNALVALGPLTYLEIVGPDPELPPPEGSRPFGVSTLKTARLVTWVARGKELGQIVQRAKRCGLDLGSVQSRSRRRADGSVLSWTMTDLSMPRAGGIVPYFIDWGDTPHPASTSPAGCTLLALRAEHPRADQIRMVLDELGLDLPVALAAEPALMAIVATPRGQVELR